MEHVGTNLAPQTIEDFTQGLKCFDENVTEYGEEEYYKDLLVFTKRMSLSNKTKMDSWISRQTVQKYCQFTDDEIKKFLNDPRGHEKELRSLSRQLENTSQIYQRIVGYLPSLAVVNPIIIPTLQAEDNAKLNKQYKDAMIYLSTLNLQKQLIKVYRTVFREDVFYGLEFETDNEYHIKQLDQDYCRINGVVGGSFTFEMDMNYFLQQKNQDVNITLLEEYDQYCGNKGFFTRAFNKSRTNYLKRWVEIPAEYSICIKLKEELDYCYPPYASVYNSIKNIEDYKALNKIAEEQANYKIIGFKIPTFSGSNLKGNQQDAFSIKLSTAQTFNELAREAIAESIGIFYSPMDWDSISFNEGTTNGRNTVKEATDQLYDSLGISRLVFNSDNATTLQYSIKCDESVLFALNRQIETWITRKFYYKFSNKWNFVCQIPDLTIYNRKEMMESYISASQSGYPTVIHACASMGIPQQNIAMLSKVQNDIMKIHDNFLPLATSYTQSSGDSKAGRPTEENPNSEVTISNRDRGTDEEKKAMAKA